MYQVVIRPVLVRVLVPEGPREGISCPELIGVDVKKPSLPDARTRIVEDYIDPFRGPEEPRDAVCDPPHSSILAAFAQPASYTGELVQPVVHEVDQDLLRPTGESPLYQVELRARPASRVDEV